MGAFGVVELVMVEVLSVAELLLTVWLAHAIRRGVGKILKHLLLQIWLQPFQLRLS